MSNRYEHGRGVLAVCGIAGAINIAADRAAATVGLLNAAQRHRGPDHSVVVRIGGFTLGNTRLAIQDPGPAGNQPFVSSDGRYHCVFNGEIYNHRDLVRRYRLPVRTACDGEVIPELWAKLGIAALAELRGMYAIALVDSLQERLYLARDPFGIKPMHWRKLSESLVFASEIRPLAGVYGDLRIDPDAVRHYLRFGAIAADEAPFAGITALAPNTVATLDAGCRVSMRPILPDGPLASRNGTDDLGSALADSIELHLGADVPTALLLSGGVDSATIAAVARRLGRDLDCLTVAAEGAADESAEAARTARHYGHGFRQIPAALRAADVTRFFSTMQRPSIDGLNTFLISKAVHDAGFKVALSGLGGDEAVGGYSHFRLLRYLPAGRALDRLPDSVNSAVAALLSRTGAGSQTKLRRLLAADGPRNGWGLSQLQREVLPGPLAAALTGATGDRRDDPARDLGGSAAHDPASFGAMVDAEVAIYLQPVLLPDADGFSMASSVELRVPFVDHRVFSAALALAERTGKTPGKKAIGIALGDRYLQSLAGRPKRGFSVPVHAWMAGPLAPMLQAANEPDAAVWSVVDRSVADRAGLTPLVARSRWAETWVFAALNAWIDSLK